MIKAAIIASFCLLAATLPSLSQDPTRTATDEGIRRQYNTMVLRDTLKKADDALAKNDLLPAAKLYTSAWDLILSIGPGVEPEARHTQQGAAAARMPLGWGKARQRRMPRISATPICWLCSRSTQSGSTCPSGWC